MPRAFGASKKKSRVNHKSINVKKRDEPWTKDRLIVIGLLAILICTSVYAVAFATGPSHYGDDIAYTSRAYQASIGKFQQTMGDVLSIRILQIFPTAFFYTIFGYGKLSSSAWDILAYVLSVFLTFLIGREIYDDKIGLLAAALMAVFPMAAMYSTTMSDNPTMMFFVCVSVLCFLKAMKSKEKKWYFATGLSLILAPLVTPEGLILWIVLGLFFIIEVLRGEQKLNMTFAYLALGFLIALGVLCLFNYISTGYPLITFTSNAVYYSQTYRPDLTPQPFWPSVEFYIGVMFPYKLLSTAYAIITGHAAIASIFSVYNQSIGDVGFYFYALVIAAIYLVLRKDRKHTYFLLFWIIVTLLYLEFGPMQISLHPLGYTLSHRLDRYLLFFAPAMAILLSAALIGLIRSSRKWMVYVSCALAVIAIVFLIATSVPILVFNHQVIGAESYSNIQIANYLSNVSNQSKIYLDGGDGDLALYMKFNNYSRFEFGYGGYTNCTQISEGSYVVMPRYVNIDGLNYIPNPPAYCNWTLVLSPDYNGTQMISGISAPFQNNLYFVPR